jgi:hypothetical protein
MNKNFVNRKIKQGARAATDKKNPQQRQVIAAAGKLRIQVGKGNPENGKTNN